MASAARYVVWCCERPDSTAGPTVSASRCAPATEATATTSNGASRRPSSASAASEAWPPWEKPSRASRSGTLVPTSVSTCGSTSSRSATARPSVGACR
ncbi:hypothetical protein [Ornithinimicrobium sp. W1665]|uniref:hypothetical protein n=1 Tax=Ornithinimicrobium sp. W1665 TaxID=3416666 RepID=UPI003D6B6BFF